MPDRTKIPDIKGINRLELPEPQQVVLSNGIPMYVLSMGKQEVCKLELVFRAGRPFEHKQLVARATNALIKEGSQKYTGAAIAEEMDYYGCSLSTPFNIDVSTITLYAVNKHLDKVLPLLTDLLSAPTFPQRELDSFIKRNRQRLLVDLTKSDALAYRKITELIFGPRHPYGYNSFPDTYGRLTKDDLVGHHRRLHVSGNAMVFFSGKISNEMIKRVDEAVSSTVAWGERAEPFLPEITSEPEKVYLSQENSLQTAVRLGRRMPNRDHPDYPGLYLLNMVLGGYFGSRLMNNIREKQGYTYNIYSLLDPMVFDGGFFIGTEVSNETVKDTLRQIHIELERLRSELIGEEELEMVRNYTLGYLLTLMDGTFSIAELIKTLYVDGLSIDFVDRLSMVVKNISAKELRTLARQYFQPDSLWEVVVGPNV